MFNDACTLLSIVIAFSSVCVSLYAVHQSRKSVLSGAFFSEMTQAYADFLRCVSEFVYRRGLPERDALSAALYRLSLFASIEISHDAQDLHVFLLDWASSNPSRALAVDEMINQIAEKMRRHLDAVQKRGGAT